jgi:ribosomal-protein-serine acetyltransferase
MESMDKITFNLKVDEEIQLRNIHPDDAEALFDLMERNRARLRPWIHPSSLPETAKAARLFTVKCLFNFYGDPTGPSELDQYFHELEFYFPPSHRPLDLGIWFHDELAGAIMMSRLEDSSTALEFGYWITAEHEGKGIITRCVSALMDYAIDEMDIQRFVIGCAVNNQRSRAVPERLGYRLHVTQPNGEVVGEFVYDRAIYGIRSSDYKKSVNI